MRLLIALLWLVGAGGIAVAEEAPLPRPRPPIWIQPQSFREAAGPDFDSADVTSDPTECNKRIQAIAVTEPLPRLIGPEACGGSDMLRLEAALRSDGARIELKPAPVLRCEYAESVAAWLRDEAAPRVEKLGAPLRTVETYDDFECRGRNRVAGAKLSEHGKANALDIRSFTLADGRTVRPTDPAASRDFREEMRTTACARFMTVLGPGSDGYHEEHIHVDLAERHNSGYRICHWEMREPAPGVDVPLPRPRPAFNLAGQKL